MKNILMCGLLLSSMNVIAANNTLTFEGKLIQQAIKEGYQVQRNLAFDYQTGSAKFGGSDLIKKDMVKSCAWRKILLISNPEKIDQSDTGNERFSCEKLNFEQDEQVWKIVHQFLPLINNLKQKGQYMVLKDEPLPEKEKLEIIDVDS